MKYINVKLSITEEASAWMIEHLPKDGKYGWRICLENGEYKMTPELIIKEMKATDVRYIHMGVDLFLDKKHRDQNPEAFQNIAFSCKEKELYVNEQKVLLPNQNPTP